MTRKYVKCRECGEEFYKEKGKRRICSKCVQAACEHEFQTVYETSSLKVVQCDKCHHVKPQMKSGVFKARKV